MLCSGKSIRIFSSALNTDLKLTKLSGETAASIFKFFFPNELHFFVSFSLTVRLFCLGFLSICVPSFPHLPPLMCWDLC